MKYVENIITCDYISVSKNSFSITLLLRLKYTSERNWWSYRSSIS